MSINQDIPSTVTIPDSVAWQQFAGEVVLVDLNAGEYHNLNDVAARMWQALDENDDVESAYAQLSEIYEVDPQTLRADLASFIRELLEKGLLSTP